MCQHKISEDKQCSRKTEPFCKQHAAQHAEPVAPGLVIAVRTDKSTHGNYPRAHWMRRALENTEYIPHSDGCDFSNLEQDGDWWKVFRPSSICDECKRRHDDSSIYMIFDDQSKRAYYACVNKRDAPQLWWSCTYVSPADLDSAEIDSLWARRLRVLPAYRFEGAHLAVITAAIRDDNAVPKAVRLATWLDRMKAHLGDVFDNNRSDLIKYWMDCDGDQRGKVELATVLGMIRKDNRKEYDRLRRAMDRGNDSIEDDDLSAQMLLELADHVGRLSPDLIRQDNGLEFNDLSSHYTRRDVAGLALLIRQTVINCSNNGQATLFVKCNTQQKHKRELISCIKYEPRVLSALKGYSIDVDYQGLVIANSLSNILQAVLRQISFRQVVVEPFGVFESDDAYKRERFNLFSGFLHKYDPEFVVDESIVHVWADHIKRVLANDDEAVYLHILRVFRHMLVNPMDKSGLVMIIRGLQGSGKNCVFDVLYRWVFGPNLTLTTPQMNLILGRFNSIRQSLLGCCLDEAVDNSDRAAMNRFKNLVTSDEVQIERKCADAYTVSDYTNYVVISNGDFSSFIEESDRRSLCMETSDVYRGDHDYFDHFWSTLNNLEAGKHIFHWLINSIDTPPKWRAQQMPVTKYKQELKRAQASTPIKYLLSMRDQLIDNVDRVRKELSDVEGDHTEALEAAGSRTFRLTGNDTLFAHYVKWCDDTHCRAISKPAFDRIVDPKIISIRKASFRLKLLRVGDLTTSLAAFL